MPVLKSNTITNAKFGNTDLSAVYKGSTQIWTAAPDLSLVLNNTFFVKNPSSSVCTRGSRYDLAFQGICYSDDPSFEIVCQYYSSLNNGWIPAGDLSAYWSLGSIWGIQSAVPFNFSCTYIYTCNSSGTPARFQGRMKARTSDGNETEWAYSPPTSFKEGEEVPEVFTELEESEIDNG